MENTVERCGVHTATEALSDLRRQLCLLGEEECDTQAAASLVVAPSRIKDLLSISRYTRIDGEPIATRLELERETAELELRLKLAAQAELFAHQKDELSSSESTQRSQLVADSQAERALLEQQSSVDFRVKLARCQRQEVAERQRQAGCALLEHNRMIADMDRDHLVREREWVLEVAAEKEALRRLAEEAERRRMTAEKRTLLPEQDLGSSVPPFLLTSYERFLPCTTN